jgi:hypothetical protein
VSGQLHAPAATPVFVLNGILFAVFVPKTSASQTNAVLRDSAI